MICSQDGFLGLPFDVKDGGPDEGYLKLVRNCRDEIVEVEVRPYYGCNDRIGWHHESLEAARERVMKFFKKVEDRGSPYDDEEEEEIKRDEKDILYDSQNLLWGWV
ncbi:hypothetical protein M5689_000673 [Euphorbia peplus]|nr:hypothetical protein M5689_000673 [Euphorbia peplus]